MTRTISRDTGAGTLLPPIFARRDRIATYLPRPTAEQSARRAVLADITSGRAVTPADVLASEVRHGVRVVCETCGGAGNRADRPDIRPHDCPGARPCLTCARVGVFRWSGTCAVSGHSSRVTGGAS